MDTAHPIGPNPSGLCQCGCGGRTGIATRARKGQDWVKGQPVRFLRGHGNRPTEDWTVDSETECWLWNWAKVRGYGRARQNGRFTAAHRAVWQDRFGRAPDDMDVHHKCRNKGCVNPEHLELLDHRQHGRLSGREGGHPTHKSRKGDPQ